MKKIYLFVLLLFCIAKVDSQVNYTFVPTTGTYVSIVGGTPATLIKSAPTSTFTATDEGYQNGVNIGFPFNYNGTVYNTININSNGFASFAAFVPIPDTDAEDYWTDDLEDGPLVFSTNIRPILAPLWDDLDMASASNIQFATTGTAPNRVFTIEWVNARWDYSATGPVISFQLRLYEGSNIVEFIYRSEAGNRAQDFSNGASIGITSTAFGDGSYLSLNNSGAAPTTSSTTPTATITAKPATNQVYRFTPTFALPISLLSFKAEKMNGSNKLTWATASEQNNKGFELQRSADGRIFASISFVESQAPNGNSTSNLTYTFDDVKPLRGSAFYRLKQVDKDNKSVYSQIVLLKGVLATRLEIRNIFPNPAVNGLNLLVSVPENDKLNLIVSDLNGKVVMVKTVDAISGDNSINLNVSRLAAGNYSIKAQCTNGCEPVSARFVKH